MKKITFLLVSVLISAAAIAQPFSALYTFDSIKTTSGTTDPSFIPTATGMNFGSFSATGTPPNSLAAARFDFSDWALGSVGGTADTLFSGMTGSISTAEYYEVTLTPQVGYSMNLDSIKFSFERSGTGIRTYVVRSSIDSYATNLTAVYGVPTTNVDVQTGNIFFLKKDIVTTQNRNIIVLGGATYTTLTAPVTFRFYAWNAEATTGTFSIDNVRFIGNTTMATGIAEQKLETMAVYPNPSSNGIFTLDIPNNALVSVYNIIGKELFSKELTAGKQQIDLSNQSNGSYFVKIANDRTITTKKIIINR